MAVLLQWHYNISTCNHTPVALRTVSAGPVISFYLQVLHWAALRCARECNALSTSQSALICAGLEHSLRCLLTGDLRLLIPEQRLLF